WLKNFTVPLWGMGSSLSPFGWMARGVGPARVSCLYWGRRNSFTRAGVLPEPSRFAAGPVVASRHVVTACRAVAWMQLHRVSYFQSPGRQMPERTIFPLFLSRGQAKDSQKRMP